MKASGWGLFSTQIKTVSPSLVTYQLSMIPSNMVITARTDNAFAAGIEGSIWEDRNRSISGSISLPAHIIVAFLNLQYNLMFASGLDVLRL